jgi:hypothetical protein
VRKYQGFGGLGRVRKYRALEVVGELENIGHWWGMGVFGALEGGWKVTRYRGMGGRN